jgi:hypothetical protein
VSARALALLLPLEPSAGARRAASAESPLEQRQPLRRPRGAGRRSPSADDSFAEIEGRRLDSDARWLDANQAPRGELTAAELRARAQEEGQAGMSAGGEVWALAALKEPCARELLVLPHSA